MKKFLLSIFAVMLAVFSIQAEEVSGTITFKTGSSDSSNAATVSNFVSGQVTNNGGFTLTCTATNNCYTGKSGLKMSSSSKNGSFTLNLGGTYNVKKVIVSAVKYGSDAGIVAVNDATAQSLSSATATDYTFEINSDISQVKVGMTKRGYIASITIVYEVAGEGGDETPVVDVAEPTFAPVDGTTFGDEGLNVTINAEDGLTVYYSTDNKTTYTESNTLNIAETTTVYAYAEDAEGNKSDVVSATYTYIDPNAKTATLSFASTAQRTSFSTSQQVWEQNGITFTNDKASSTTNVADYSNPVRLYKGSNITISAAREISKIEFDCVENYVISIDGATTDGTTVTVNVIPSSKTYTVTGLSAQRRLNSITVTFATGNEITPPTLPAAGDFIGSKEVTITNNAEGTTLYYSTDNVEFVEYTTPLTITETTTVYAYAEDADGNKSEAVSATYTKVLPAQPTMPETQSFTESLSVEITAAEGAAIYYTLDGSDPTTGSTQYVEAFTITETTTVKAIAVVNGISSKIATATYTLFVLEETEGYYVKVTSAPADWSGKYLIVYEDATDAYVFNGKDEVNGYVSATTNGYAIAANSEVDAVAVTIATMEGGYSIKTADGYIYGASNGNKLSFNATTTQLNTIELDANGAVITSGRILQFNSASNQMRFRYYTKDSQKPVQLYKYTETLPEFKLNVSAAGYATLFLDFPVAIPEGVETYIVKQEGINENYISLTQVTGVLPANTGVIVKAYEGNYSFAASADAVADVTGNLLEGVLVDTEMNVEYYVLANGENGIGLYLVQEKIATDAKTAKANKAYLPASAVTGTAASSNGFRFEFGDGTTTEIEKVEMRNEKEEIFDLQGRRINEITCPGIYIVNGKKTLVK